MASKYGWICTSSSDEGDGWLGAVGPYDISDDMKRQLRDGEGTRWRTLYDEDYPGCPVADRIAHEGRYIGPDSDDMFAPLDDLSGPANGAFEIQYLDKSEKWNTL